MFEREIKFIYDFNVNQVKKLGTSFTFNSLTTVSVHPAVLKYISAEIDYLIYEDRKRLVENSNFDYTGESINKYFTFINDEIKKEKRLSIEYINQLIIHATSFTVNFLAQPKWALTKLIFAKENTLNAGEVKQILNYLFYYNHLRELLDKFLTKKRLVSIEKSEFENLVDKIYRQLFSDYSEKIMDSVFNSMADFFNVGGINKTKIPYLALELFLKEKNLDVYLERLNAAISEDAKQNYSVVELKKIIYSLLPVQKENYLDRIVKQEEPQIIFSKDKMQEEAQPSEESFVAEEIIPLDSPVPGNEIVDKIIEAESETAPEAKENLEEITEQENFELQVEDESRISDKTDIENSEDQINEMMQELQEEKINFSDHEEHEVIKKEEKLNEDFAVENGPTPEDNVLSPSEEVEEGSAAKEEESKSLQDEDFVKELFTEPEEKTELTNQEETIKEESVQEESVKEESNEEELSTLSTEITEEKEENNFFDKEIEWESEPEESKLEEVIESNLENIFEEEKKDITDIPGITLEDLGEKEKEDIIQEEKTGTEEVEEKIKEEVPEEKVAETEIEETEFTPYFNDEDLLILKDEDLDIPGEAKEDENKIQSAEERIEEGKIEEEKPEEIQEKEDEGFDLDTVFDEKDLLIFEEDKSDVPDEKNETDDQAVKEEVIPEEESFDESSLSLLEEKELPIEVEEMKELDEEMNEEIKEEKIVNEPDDDETSPSALESKLLEEINDEIKELSDDTESDITIEELENIEMEEHKLEKADEKLPVVIEELSMAEEEKAEVVEIQEKERRPVKFERDISYFFKGKNIDRIISNIFDDDAEDFAQTFEKLSECNLIEEALAILDALFKSNRIKPTSKEAVLITNIVNEYFNQK